MRHLILIWPRLMLLLCLLAACPSATPETRTVGRVEAPTPEPDGTPEPAAELFAVNHPPTLRWAADRVPALADYLVTISTQGLVSLVGEEPITLVAQNQGQCVDLTVATDGTALTAWYPACRFELDGAVVEEGYHFEVGEALDAVGPQTRVTCSDGSQHNSGASNAYHLGGLSHHTDDFIAFHAHPVGVTIDCQRRDWRVQTCLDGSTRRCESCGAAYVVLQGASVRSGGLAGLDTETVAPTPVDCAQPCPADGLSAAIIEVNDALAYAPYTLNAGAGTVLYRSEAACQQGAVYDAGLNILPLAGCRTPQSVADVCVAGGER